MTKYEQVKLSYEASKAAIGQVAEELLYWIYELRDHMDWPRDRWALNRVTGDVHASGLLQRFVVESQPGVGEVLKCQLSLTIDDEPPFTVDLFALGRTDRGLLVVLVAGEQITVSKSSPEVFFDKAVEHIRQQARRVGKMRRVGAGPTGRTA
ncbi:hypothetical protein SOCEGT47_077830 [Sorangium cellulosum]|uniref:Uncharacterized protein n=1 Tax=Sorangium cellulosum TaxID=56 RepID=A0A4V0NES6_SORCE|nr:hypothetical protein [Sorangium cellulosum]AUX27202.1 hypothetical protein SOCEGT47_077830 [Sorangium cellulosum]